MITRLYHGSTERDRQAVEQLQVEHERREAHRERDAGEPPKGSPYNEACREKDMLWRQIVDLWEQRRAYATDERYAPVVAGMTEVLDVMIPEHELLELKCDGLRMSEVVKF